MTLAQWIDPDDPNQVTLDGTQIRQIADKSAAGNDVVGVGGAATFLARFNGADGQTNYVSEDSALRPATFVGAELDTAQKQFGVSSALLSTNSPAQAIRFPNSSDFHLGSGNFTVECWVRFNGDPGTAAVGLVTFYMITGNERSWAFFLDNNQLSFSWTTDGTGGTFSSITGSWNPVDATWYHLAACRSGTTLRLFANGVQVGSGTMSDTPHPSTVANLTLGNYDFPNSPLSGWIDEVRISVGTALYTGAFSPLPSAEFPAGPEQASTFYVNKSPGSYAIDTRAGGFLAAENRSPNLVNMDGPDFSVSLAIQDYPTSSPIDIDGSTLFGMYATASPEDDAGWKIEDLTGGDIFRARVGSADPIDLVPEQANVVLLASFDGDDGDTAYVSQDKKRRTATFTATAQLDTAQSKFGKSSLLLDGNSDYVEFPDSFDFTFDGDFTIEAWVRYAVVPTADSQIVSHYDSQSGNNRSFLFHYGLTGSKLTIQLSGDGSSLTNINGNWTPIVDTWYHVAATRSGTSVNVWLDGVSVGSGTFSGALYNTPQPLCIGSVRGTSGFTQYHNGWIEDVRIVKGEALYTGTFTPPTRSHARTLGDNDSGVLSMVYDSTKGFIQTYVNSVEAGSIPYTGTPGFAQNLTLGGNSAGSFQNGLILESVYYDGVLLSDQIERLEGYMAHKWNFPEVLPATHPFRYRGPDRASVQYPETVFVANFDIATDAVASPPGYLSETGQEFNFRGNANLDTNRAPFSGSSVLLDGTGDYIETADSDDWNLDGDFTLECWVYFDALPSAGNAATWMSNWNTNGGASERGWTFGFQNVSPQRIRFFSSTDSAGTGQVDMFATWNPVVDTWYHCAVSREGSTVRLFVDGQQVGTDLDYGSPVAIYNASTTLAFGVVKASAGLFYHQGSIGPARIVKGKAIYTRDFVPPPRKFKVQNYTVPLIANFNGADGIASPPGYTSEDAAARTMSFIGNAQLDTAEKKFGVSSLKLDGTGDYTEIPDSDDWTFDGDFTIECWVKFSSVPTNAGFVTHYDSQSGNNRSWIFGKFGTNLRAYFSTDGSAGTVVDISRSWSPSTDVWYHCAVERFGSTVQMYVDGVALGTAGTLSGSLHNCTDPLRIGATRAGGGVTDFMNGWIDSVRIIKGYALRSTVNPPEIPYDQNRDGGTLIVNFEGASPATSYSTDDNLNIPLIFYNSAALTTAERYSGQSCLAAVAEGDGVGIPQQSPEQFALGTGDFTIEFMCKFAAAVPTSVYNAIIDQRDSGTAQVRPYIGTTGSGGQFVFYVNGADRIVGSSTPVTGRWYHVVIERVNGVTRMYEDGVEQGSPYTDSNNYLDGEWTIGTRWDQAATNNSFEGWIDNFRVTQGQAIYRGGFTPPTKQIGEPIL
jgi:hypothetical protein